MGLQRTGWLATGTTADATKPTLVTNLTNVSQFAFGNDGGPLTGGSFSLAVGTLPGTVPSLIGDTLAQAGAVLTAAGLGLGTVSYVTDYTWPPSGRALPEPVRGDLRGVRLGGLGHDREGPAASFSMPFTSRCTSARGPYQDPHLPGWSTARVGCPF